MCHELTLSVVWDGRGPLYKPIRSTNSDNTPLYLVVVLGGEHPNLELLSLLWVYGVAVF